MQGCLRTWNSEGKAALKNLSLILSPTNTTGWTSTMNTIRIRTWIATITIMITTTTTIRTIIIITTISTRKTEFIYCLFFQHLHMKKSLTTLALALCASMLINCHAQVIDPIKFFESNDVLEARLNMDIPKLVRTSMKPEYLPATFSCKIGDDSISEEIRVIARGHIRKEICYMPPVKLNFHNSTSPKLYPLNSLKMVCTCFENSNGDQLLLKEYLIYKMYNLITDKSFRVRLLNLSYEDVNPKKKTYLGHAFLIESDKSMAKRNDCVELKNTRSHSEYADRDQMTIFAIFQYMIGNTDFGVSANHNIILIQPAKDSTAKPIVIPYDFDYAGLVDA